MNFFLYTKLYHIKIIFNIIAFDKNFLQLQINKKSAFHFHNSTLKFL